MVRALARLERDLGGEIRVVTLVPPHLREVGERYGAALPGELVPSRSGLGGGPPSVPRPAIEVWSASGELLLTKTIPANAREEVLYEEIYWLRSETEPPRS